jgi:predicted glycoside hydrolase/deacetylase ChbG (UPF0249 family)
MSVESGRTLIVNADDFGHSPGVNSGIIHAYEHGIVTSASLMVLAEDAAEAAAYAREHNDLSLGLHIDLGEWAYVQDEWTVHRAVVPLDDPQAIRAEVERQLGEFRRLVGRDPTHLDSHQHVHREEPIRSIVPETGRSLHTPVRWFDPVVQFCGDFYGQAEKGAPYPEGISVDALLAIFSRLGPGVTEIGCHPGLDDDLDSAYRTERRRELTTLCNPRVRAALAAQGIALASFESVALGRIGAARLDADTPDSPPPSETAGGR